MDELENAKRYKEVCDGWFQQLTKATSEPLTLTKRDRYGDLLGKKPWHDGCYTTVETGVLWIGLTCPPHKVIKPKCVCPSCGSRHTKRG